MQDFRKLLVWQKAHRFVLSVYKCSERFPKSETFGLTSQLRRAAVSIPSNIAEGCVRDSDPEFARFLKIALGSTSESEYQLLLAHELGYLSNESYQQLNDENQETKRLLINLIKRLNTKT